MLNFNDSLLISSSVFFLLASVARCDCLGAIGWRLWVEHPHIKVGTLPVTPPEALSHDIKSCIVLHIGSSVGESFSSSWVGGVVLLQRYDRPQRAIGLSHLEFDCVELMGRLPSSS